MGKFVKSCRDRTGDVFDADGIGGGECCKFAQQSVQNVFWGLPPIGIQLEFEPCSGYSLTNALFYNWSRDMRFTKTLAAVAITAMTATTAMAGGLAPTAPAPTVVVPVEPAAPAPSSWGIILPIVGAALLIGLAVSSDDDSK